MTLVITCCSTSHSGDTKAINRWGHSLFILADAGTVESEFKGFLFLLHQHHSKCCLLICLENVYCWIQFCCKHAFSCLGYIITCIAFMAIIWEAWFLFYMSKNPVKISCRHFLTGKMKKVSIVNQEPSVRHLILFLQF